MSARKMSRRQMLKGLGMAVAGTALAACAPQTVKETVVVEKIVEKPVEKVVKETVVVVAPKGPVSLRFTTDWYGGTRGQLTNMFLSEWKDNVHPDIRIAYEPCPRVQDRLRVDFAAGTPPDVMLFAPELYASFGDQLLDLDPFWGDEDPEIKDDMVGFDPSFTYGGHLVAIPFQHNIWGPMINEDVFKEAGVPMPWEYDHDGDKWWNWDDLLETCKAIQALGDDYYGYDVGGSATYMAWGPWIMTNGGQYVDPEWPDFGQNVVSTLDSPAAVEALEFVTSLMCTHDAAIPVDVAQALSQSLNMSPFYAGKIGVAQNCSEGGIKGAEGLNAYRVATPRSPHTGTATQHQGNCPHVAWKETEYPNESYMFMTFTAGYWAQKQVGLLGGAMPGSKKALADPEFYSEFPPIAREALLQSAEENKCLPGAYPNFEEWRDEVEAIALDMFLCKIPTGQGIAEMHETAERILAKPA